MAQSSRPARRKGQRTATAILDATSEIIAERGVNGFTISDVGRRAKVNRALVYHYFGDRENLIIEAIRHIVYKYEEVRPAIGGDALERDIRLHIDHPELARFFFQLALNKQPFPRMSQRLRNAISDLEELQTSHRADGAIDAPMAILAGWIMQLGWSCAREELARYLEVDVETADRRFIEHMRRSGDAILSLIKRSSG